MHISRSFFSAKMAAIISSLWLQSKSLQSGSHRQCEEERHSRLHRWLTMTAGVDSVSDSRHHPASEPLHHQLHTTHNNLTMHDTQPYNARHTTSQCTHCITSFTRPHDLTMHSLHHQLHATHSLTMHSLHHRLHATVGGQGFRYDVMGAKSARCSSGGPSTSPS